LTEFDKNLNHDRIAGAAGKDSYTGAVAWNKNAIRSFRSSHSAILAKTSHKHFLNKGSKAATMIPPIKMHTAAAKDEATNRGIPRLCSVRINAVPTV
jgi:hypothetical protein